MINFNKRENKYLHYPINKVNIFEGKDVNSFSFTNHFFDRWNERIPSLHFSTKYELENYIKAIYDPKIISHISGNYYFLNNLIITADIDYKDGSIVFITVLGTIENNPVLYNVLVTQGVKGMNNMRRMYGKVNILPN